MGLISSVSKDGVGIEFDDGREHIMSVQSHLLISGNKGDIVSLIPMCVPVTGITTRGLRYSLDNESLFPNQTRGISNVMTEENAEITITSGIILCVHIRKQDVQKRRKNE